MSDDMLGQFGQMKSKLGGEKIITYGWIREMDSDRIWFEDNHNHYFIFLISESEFKPMKFKDKTK